MHFLGVRRSARVASHYFPRLRRMVDGGRGLKQRTIESKIRAAYKKGIDQSLLVRHEAVLDRTRVVTGRGAGVVKHYLLVNPDRTAQLEEVAPEVIRLMDEHPNTKARFVLKVHFRDLNNEEEPEKEFIKGLRSGQNETRPKGENTEVYFEKIGKEVLQSFEDMKREKSNLVVSFIEHGELTFSKTDNNGVAGHHAPLPKYLRSKNAIINIQNKDEYCFKWAVATALNLEKKNNVHVNPFLREKAEELDWSGITFPVSMEGEDIVTFERNNKIGVAIYACSEEEEGKEFTVYRHRTPAEKFKKIVNLFAMKLPQGGEFDYHFCVVKRLSALLRKCEGKDKKVVCCSYCSARFYNKIGIVEREGKAPRKGVVKNAQELRVEHELVCKQVTNQKYTPQEKMPKPGENILELGHGTIFLKAPCLG